MILNHGGVVKFRSRARTFRRSLYILSLGILVTPAIRHGLPVTGIPICTASDCQIPPARNLLSSSKVIVNTTRRQWPLCELRDRSIIPPNRICTKQFRLRRRIHGLNLRFWKRFSSMSFRRINRKENSIRWSSLIPSMRSHTRL